MKNNRIGLFVILGLVLIGFWWLFFREPGVAKFDWNDNYRYNRKEPYDLYVFYQLMGDYGNSMKLIKEPLAEVMNDTTDTNSLYMMVGNSSYLDSSEIGYLKKFVERGNDAFFSLKSVEGTLGSDFGFYSNKCTSSYGIASQSFRYLKLNFYNRGIQMDKSVVVKRKYDGGEVYEASWEYFIADTLCKDLSPLERLGYIQFEGDDQKANFLRIPFGKGNFYFHVTPIAFTNYHLLSKSNLEYCERVMSYMNTGKIYWDEYDKYYHYTKTPKGKLSKGPLSYILAQKSLKWAWYLLLALLFMYILFRIKRRQRTIPVIEQKVNTSLEFVQTLGQLYFQQQDHKRLCEQKMRLFLVFVRTRYYLATNMLDERFMRKLSDKSGVEYEKVKELFTKGSFVSTNKFGQPTKEDVVAFHQLIEYFYKHCK